MIMSFDLNNTPIGFYPGSLDPALPLQDVEMEDTFILDDSFFSSISDQQVLSVLLNEDTHLSALTRGGKNRA